MHTARRLVLSQCLARALLMVSRRSGLPVAMARAGASSQSYPVRRCEDQATVVAHRVCAHLEPGPGWTSARRVRSSPQVLPGRRRETALCHPGWLSLHLWLVLWAVIVVR